MEQVQINSFESFQAIISKMPHQKIIFRGVNNSEYALITSVGRAYNAKRKSGFPAYERSLISRFRERAIPYLISIPATDLEWLALAQHHGLPTRLLDWTYNPLVALYFATTMESFETLEREEHDCAVYIYNTPNKTLNSTFTDDPFKINKTIKYRPSHFTDRIIAQRSVFTLHHEPRIAFDKDDRITKIIINGKCKQHFRDNLKLYGIGPSTLFPSLDGLAQELCNY